MTFTKEQLIARAETVLSNARTAADFHDRKPYHLMDIHLAEIALASLEAEPVAWITKKKTTGEMELDEPHAKATNPKYWTDAFPVYTTPPAPVSVPDDVLDALQKVARIRLDLNDFDGDRRGIADCLGDAEEALIEVVNRSAAMLQGIQPVSNRDELPLGYLQGHKDGLEWAAQLAEANHPQTGDWLYDDPIDLAKAIRKGPHMPELKLVPADADDNFYSWFGRFWHENYQQNNYTTSAKQMLGTMAEFAFRAGRESATQAGNSPVIPDGWIPVSERMPETDGNYWGWWSESKRQGPVWFIKSELQAQFQSSEITHWMPLPAAPQQEVKSALEHGMQRYAGAMQKLSEGDK